MAPALAGGSRAQPKNVIVFHMNAPFAAPTPVVEVSAVAGPSGLDVFGAAASLLCAAHCAAMPLVLALMPMAGLEGWGSHTFDVFFVVFALLFGAFAIGRGYRRHRQVVVLRWFAAASIVLALGLTLLHDYWWHVPALVCGGLLLGWTHLLNLRYLRHPGCTAADHGHPPAAPSAAVKPARAGAAA